jgi:phage terminase small subunit
MTGYGSNVEILDVMWHYVTTLIEGNNMNVTIGERTIVLTDEQISSYGKLTKLQQGVALNSLHGMKPADAHREAGGKCKNEANRYKLAGEILIKPDVVAFMTGLKQDPAPDIALAVMSRDQMLQDLTIIANATIGDVVNFSNIGRELMDIETGEMVPDQSTIYIKSLSDIKPEHQCLIKGVKQTKNGLELILHDSMTARKQIADMCGYNAPIKSELTGANGGPISIAELTNDDLLDELAKLGLDTNGL